MKKRILFITGELFPYTPGGLGSFIAHTSKILKKDYDIHIVTTGIKKEDLKDFEKKEGIKVFDAFEFINHEEKNILNNSVLNKSNHLREALIWFFAVLNIVKVCRYDMIQFYDFGAPAYFILKYKRQHKLLNNIIISVHNHLTFKMIHYKQNDLSRYVYWLGEFERKCLMEADSVYFASKSQAKMNMDFFEYEPKNICISGLPITSNIVCTNKIFNKEKVKKSRDILFVAKIQLSKGIDILIEAVYELLKDKNDITLHMVGTDTPFDDDKKLSEILMKKVPSKYHKFFKFYGHVNHDKIDELIKKSKFAVIPSRIETFSYVAHELYRKGIPLILNKIPAFLDFFKNEENCIYFDGTKENLKKKIKFAFDNESILYSLNDKKIEYINFKKEYEKCLNNKSILTKKDNLKSVDNFISEEINTIRIGLECVSNEININRYKQEIKKIKSSKFWKMRNIYIHYKEGIKEGIKNPFLIITFLKKRFKNFYNLYLK